MTNKKKYIVNIENSWGEMINMLMVSHWEGDINGRSEETHKFEFMDSIQNKQKKHGVLSFEYELSSASMVDYWQIIFTTMNNKGFITKGDFYCHVSNDENNTITIYINGDLKQMHVTYSYTPSCSTPIYSS